MSLRCISLMLTNLYFNSNIFCICVFAVVFFQIHEMPFRTFPEPCHAAALVSCVASIHVYELQSMYLLQVLTVFHCIPLNSCCGPSTERDASLSLYTKS